MLESAISLLWHLEVGRTMIRKAVRRPHGFDLRKMEPLALKVLCFFS